LFVIEKNGERAPVIWDQPEAPSRPSVPLDRARIVTAAIKLADSAGLEALTMRKLAAVLGASPMSLYRHVARKEDLIDLMLDHVAGEHDLAGIPSGDWRSDLIVLARQQRAAALRHPWSIVPVARPSLGPHAIAQLETALSVFDATGLPAGRKAWAASLVETYVRGTVEAELAGTAAEHRTGMTTGQWQKSMEPYLTRLLSTGRYPHVREFLEDTSDMSSDEAFELGLATVLDGLRRAVGSSPQAH
jgi:AcrR family transcriptional regulator